MDAVTRAIQRGGREGNMVIISFIVGVVIGFFVTVLAMIVIADMQEEKELRKRD